jgi:succinyl-diaminopimelate desuccinylase
MDHATVRAALAAQMNERADIEVLVDLPAVWTDPQTPWVRRVMDVASQVTGRAAEIRTATYFSDASLLGPALGHVPAIILGPGEPSMAHQTDEWCSIGNIERATRIYGEMILDWMRCEQAV